MDSNTDVLDDRFENTPTAAGTHAMSINSPPDDTRRTCLLVLGMRDNVARELVADAIAGVRGVIEWQVSIFHAMATVTYAPPCSPQALVNAIEHAGLRARAVGNDRE